MMPVKTKAGLNLIAAILIVFLLTASIGFVLLRIFKSTSGSLLEGSF